MRTHVETKASLYIKETKRIYKSRCGRSMKIDHFWPFPDSEKQETLIRCNYISKQFNTDCEDTIYALYQCIELRKTMGI